MEPLLPYPFIPHFQQLYFGKSTFIFCIVLFAIIDLNVNINKVSQIVLKNRNCQTNVWTFSLILAKRVHVTIPSWCLSPNIAKWIHLASLFSLIYCGIIFFVSNNIILYYIILSEVKWSDVLSTQTPFLQCNRNFNQCSRQIIPSRLTEFLLLV